MRRTILPGTAITCSVLGFGCASLTSVLHRDALRLLRQAQDEGITHFDVARSYGYGVTETILGEFLRGRRSQVTVTTKYGQGAVHVGAQYRAALAAVKSVVRKFPLLRRVAARTVASATRGAAFDAASAARSLETSLRELGTDYVDVFLLHEASFEDAARDDVREFLEAQVARGTIRACGLGGEYRRLNGDVSPFPARYGVFQFDDGLGMGHLSQLRGSSARALITFGASRQAARVHAAAAKELDVTAEFSRRLGEDLADRGVLQRLSIRHAISSNPTGVTLTATVRAAHLDANIVAAGEASMTPEKMALLSEFSRLVLEQTARRD